MYIDTVGCWDFISMHFGKGSSFVILLYYSRVQTLLLAVHCREVSPWRFVSLYWFYKSRLTLLLIGCPAMYGSRVIFWSCRELEQLCFVSCVCVQDFLLQPNNRPERSEVLIAPLTCTNHWLDFSVNNGI